jgi:hypothetical protein
VHRAQRPDLDVHGPPHGRTAPPRPRVQHAP